MSFFKESVYKQAIVASVLGSTEGTFYENSSGTRFDIRTTPITSTGLSGLSFGMTQMDVANNTQAATLFNSLLLDAYNGSRITESEKNDFAARAATPGIGSSVDAFTPTEFNKIRTEVLEPGITQIHEADMETLGGVIDEIDEVLDAVNQAWDGFGVFDPSSPDFYKAVGHLASWANRTGNLNTLKEFLRGEAVSGLDTLDHIPTFDDLEYYLTEQSQFENNPGEFENVTDNIERGLNVLPHMIPSSERIGPSEFWGPPELFGPWEPYGPWVPEAYGPFQSAPDQLSPLVIDIDGDGVELTEFDAETTTTFFDIDGDAFAEQTAWVDSDDALLARDVNEDGVIDNVTELFGSPGVDGFALLALLDSNGDLIIDAQDDAWDELLVWQDANGDAVSQSGELVSLNAAGIKNIRLDTVEGSADTIAGNLISHEALFTWSNNSTDSIVDAWFTIDDVNSYYIGDYTLNVETLFLPVLRGFGELSDLHIAMSMNEDLLELVEDFVVNFTLADFADNDGLDETITSILYAWADVSDLDPGSRGPHIDARELVFLEKFFGEELWESAFNPTPGQAAQLHNESFIVLLEYLKAALVLQAGAQELFDGTAGYNPWTAEIEGAMDLDETAVGDLADDAPVAGTANEKYWMAIARFLDTVKGLDNLTNDEETWLDDAVQESDPLLTWEEVTDLLAGEVTGTMSGTSGPDTINGTSGYEIIYAQDGNDTVNAGAGYDVVWAGLGNDEVYGGDGPDTLYGGDGSDHLRGEDGNDELHGDDSYGNADILEGGAGSNFLYGGAGDDQYIYGGGYDYILDSVGTDEIHLPVGIDVGDLTITRVVSDVSIYFDDLFITIAGAGTIQIGHGFSATSPSYNVETIVFSDTTTLDLTSLTGYETLLTAGNDTYSAGLSSDDVIYGLGGNDYIDAYDGNNTLDGGTGNDQLVGREGDDTYVASYGFDTITDHDGNDLIVIPASVNPADVYYYRVADTWGAFNDFRIFMPGFGEILILSQFRDGYDYAIEELFFEADLSTIVLAAQTIETRGGTGNDGLYGITAHGSENDILNGLGGDDSLNGGAGNDTYIFSEGHDDIYDSGGSDTIEVRDGFSPGEITIVRAQASAYHYDALQLTDNEGNIIRVLSHFDSTANTPVEYVHFKDNTVWDIFAMEIEAHGSAGNDSIAGTETGDASNADTIYGHGGNDYLWGDNGNDALYGGDGNDYVYGGEGNDLIDGGAGNDTMTGGNGTDTLSYATATAGVTVNMATTTAQNTVGAGTDTISGFEYLIGSAFNDTITGTGGGNERIEGGAGDDTINASSGFDTALYQTAASGVTVSLAIATAQNTVGAGTDTLSGFEHLTGSAHDDILTGSSTANTLTAGDGNDWIEGGAGNDTIKGDGGNDTASYASAASAVTVNVSAGTATGGAGTDTLTGIENLTGSAYDDTLTGDSNANILTGGAGNDTISAGDGDDLVNGGDGDDGLTAGNGTDTLTYADAGAGITINLATGTAQATGGSGSDTISGFENLTGSAHNDTLTGTSSANIIFGGAGADTLNGADGDDLIDGGAGNDTMTAGNGTDTLSYATASSAVTVNMATTTGQNTGGAGTDTISGFEYLAGSAFNDTLTGTGGGNERIEGGAGNDTMDGSSGFDTVLYTTASAAVTVSLAVATAQNTGGAGTDTISNFEHLTGSAHSDTLTGSSIANTLTAGNGNDTLYGGSGNDTLRGEADNDVLYGESGTDTLYGGTGADIFLFQSASAFGNVDTLKDFATGEGDAIDIRDLLVGYDPLTDAITDFVTFTNSGANAQMFVDRDGSGAGTYSSVQIGLIEGLNNLSAATLETNGNLIAV